MANRFLQLNDDCLAEAIKVCMLMDDPIVVALRKFPTPMVSTCLPHSNRLKLAFPEIEELYDRLANLYHMFELRVTTHPRITLEQWQHALPVAELRHLRLVVGFDMIPASTSIHRPGTRSFELSLLPATPSSFDLPELLERFTNLVELEIVVKDESPYSNASDNFDVDLQKVRDWLVYGVVKSFRHPVGLRSIRASMELFKTQQGHKYLTGYTRMRKVKTATGGWRMDLKEYERGNADSGLVLHSKRLGYPERTSPL